MVGLLLGKKRDSRLTKNVAEGHYLLIDELSDD